MFNTQCLLKPCSFCFEKAEFFFVRINKNTNQLSLFLSLRTIFSLFQKKSPFSIFVDSKRHVQSLRGSVYLSALWGSTL